jgi:hypothetical protein
MSNLFHRPTLFVGIGGSGIKSLALLKMQMIEAYHADPKYSLSNFKEFYENEFVFIDTTEEDIIEINKKYAPKLESLKFRTIDLIDLSAETVITGNVNPRQKAVNRRAADPQFKQWLAWNEDVALGSNQKYTYEVPTSAKDGAAADRMNGRVIFAEASREIERKIDSKISRWTNRDSIKDVANNEDPACIWVISGTNGGTGSSFTLDMLYILREYSRKFFTTSEMHINLALLAPEPYVKRNKGKYQYPLNSYAFFKEIKFFSSQGVSTPIYQEYKDFYVKSKDGENPFNINQTSVKFKPYNLAIMFDTKIKGTDVSIELDNTFENVANTLFLYNCHQVGSRIRTGLITNLGIANLKLHTVTRPNSPIKGSKWSNDVVATGSTTLKTPITYFEQYLKTKLQYDLLSGLIGTETPTNEVIYEYVQVLIPAIAKIIESDPQFQQVFRPSNTPTDQGKKEYDKNFTDFKSQSGKKIERLQKDYDDEYSDFSYNVLLDKIIIELSKKFEELILKFGYKYLDTFVFSLDQYLGKDINALHPDCAWRKLIEHKTTLEKTLENGTVVLKDFEILIRAESAYLQGEKTKFLIKTQADLVRRLYYSRNPNEQSGGVLDELRDNGNGKGINLFYTELVTLNTAPKRSDGRKESFHIQYKELCDRMQTIESEKPFEIYLPSLKEQTSSNSEFSREYAQLVNYDSHTEKINRSGINGLESLIDEIFKIKNRYSDDYPNLIASSNDIQSSSFLTIATKLDKFKWSQIADAISSLAYIKVDRFKKDSQFMQTTLIDRVAGNLESLRKIFREQDYITLPHSSDSVVKQLVYSWHSETAETQKFYRDLNINTVGNEVTLVKSFNPHEFSKVVFEAGFTFGDYEYIDEYALTHKNNLSGKDIHPAQSLWTKPLSYMNRHFIWEDWETVKQSMGIQKEVNSFVELAFYSAVLELLKDKDENYFKKIIDVVSSGASTPQEVAGVKINIRGLKKNSKSNGLFLYADKDENRVHLPAKEENGIWIGSFEFSESEKKFKALSLNAFSIKEKSWKKAVENLNNIIQQTVEVVRMGLQQCDKNAINYINNELLTKANKEIILAEIYQKVILLKKENDELIPRENEFEWTSEEFDSDFGWLNSTIDELFKKQIK